MEAIKPLIREDIEEILSLSRNDFNVWYKKRKDVTERLLSDYELFGSIPVIEFSEAMSYGGYSTHVRDHIQYLKRGLEDLNKLRDKYEKIHGTNL